MRKAGRPLTRLAIGAFAAAAAMLIGASAQAQDYPARPIQVIVPFAGGSASDVVTRILLDRMAKALGQPFIVDNRPGAGGNTGTLGAVRTAPDGYTLVMSTVGPLAANRTLVKTLGYDPEKDVTPISLFAILPNVVVINSRLPPKTLTELVAYARQHPKQLNYGTVGVGSSQHLAGALFCSTFGVNMIHVPYKGTGPVITDLTGGQINLSFANMLAALPLVRNKRLTPIGVTSLKRSPALPDVPAIAETAPGFEAVSWWGIVSTRGTPPDVVNILSRAIAKGINAPDTKAFLSNMGVEPAGTTPREFAAFIKSEMTKWAKVVKESGAKVD